jgi:class 3 adenylate cyclase/tetratricopeptide (TPR) repeat protein
VFADLQGFTARTDQLMALGNRGAERLSALLDQVFGAASAAIHRQGGWIPYFAGDAFAGIFHGNDARGSALAAAWQISEAMRELDTGLPLRIGLGDGSLEWQITATTPHRWFVRGSAISGAVASEQLAGPGDILLPAAWLPECEAVTLPVTGSDRLKLTGPPPSVARDAQPPVLHGIEDHFPAFLADRFHGGEFRTVTALFVAFPGDLDTRVTEALVRFAGAEIDRHGGYFKETDLTDKGGLLVAFFGAPVNAGDSRRSAILTALRIREGADLPPGTLRFGLATGPSYCGLAGDDHRRQYIVAGRTVNLAARLALRAAPGSLLSDTDTPDGLPVILDDPGPIEAKGFPAPVPVRLILGLLDPASEQEPCFRQALADELTALLSRREGTILELVGEPGMGKNFLAGELVKSSAEALHWLHVEGHPMRSGPFEALETAWLEANTTALFDRLGDPATIRHDTDLPGAEKFRRLQEWHAAALSTLPGHPPVAVRVDHWEDLDQAARDLLLRLTDTEGLRLLTTSRHGLEELSGLPPDRFRCVELIPFGAEEMDRLAGYRLGHRPAGPLRQLLLDTANGNPFYAEQMILYLRDHGLLDFPGDGTCTLKEADMALGGSLRDILQARIDQLGAPVRETLKRAAVIGTQFALPLLGSLSTLAGESAGELAADLQRAADAGILQAAGPATMAFRHGLVRDVVYEVQMESKVRQTHRQVVEAMEAMEAAGETQSALELARHSARAGLRTKAYRYYLRASHDAMARYQNREALDFLAQAEEHALDAGDVARLRLDSLSAHLALGEWDRVGEVLEDPVFDGITDEGLHAERLAARGHYLVLTGRYAEAGAMLEEAFLLFGQLGDRPGMARCTRDLSILSFRRGDYSAAEKHIERTFGLLPVEGRRDNQLVMNLALIRMNQGQYAEAERLLLDDLVLRLQTGERQPLIPLYVNLGVVQLEKGRYRAARENLDKGYGLAEAADDRLWMSIALGTRGQVKELEGDWAAAREDYLADLDLARTLGDPQGEAIALELLGALEIRTGNHEVGMRMASQALESSRTLGYRKGMVKARLALAWADCWQGRPAEAIPSLQQALSEAEAMGNRKLQALCSLHLAEALLALGRETKALLLIDSAEESVLYWDEPMLTGQWKRLRLRSLRNGARETALRDAMMGKDDPWTRAEAHYLRWREQRNETDRQAALDQFSALLAQSPHVLFRQRIHELQA